MAPWPWSLALTTRHMETHMCQDNKRTVGRCNMPLEICCAHLIVTRQCHGEAREIMIEKMRFILYQLPTGWMWLGKSNLASVCFLLAFDLVHRTEQVQLAADTKLTSGIDVVDTRHLEVVKRILGVHSFSYLLARWVGWFFSPEQCWNCWGCGFIM
jgi:hypothetical protein